MNCHSNSLPSRPRRHSTSACQAALRSAWHADVLMRLLWMSCYNYGVLFMSYALDSFRCAIFVRQWRSHMCPKVTRLIRRKPDENRCYGKTPKTLCSGGVNSNILVLDQSQTQWIIQPLLQLYCTKHSQTNQRNKIRHVPGELCILFEMA